MLHIGMRVSAGVAAVAMGFAVGLGTQGIGPAYAGLGIMLSGISTVATVSARNTDPDDAPGTMMPTRFSGSAAEMTMRSPTGAGKIFSADVWSEDFGAEN